MHLMYTLRHAFRTLLRQRLYTALHLTGLSLGMAAVLLIGWWVQSELRFDAWHPKADNLYRVEAFLRASDTQTWHWGTTPLKMPDLYASTPGIVSGTRMMVPSGHSFVLQHGTDLFEAENAAFTGPGWFQHFNYDFVEGNAAGFGDRANDLILSEQLARRIFGERSALGATLRMDTQTYQVHAVMRDARPESSFRQDLLLPLDNWLARNDNRRNDANWGNYNYQQFVYLHPDASATQVAQQLTLRLRAATGDSTTRLQLGALRNLHFDNSIQFDVFEKGQRSSVALFAAIGLLVLLMAAMNYVSLSTARAQTRAREAGIRRIIGAGKTQLFSQYISESLLLSAASLLLALILLHLSMPVLSAFSGRHFAINWSTPTPWLMAAGTLVGTVVLSGLYPAVFMAGFQPMAGLRAAPAGGYRSPLRRSLVVAQFSISIALLLCTLMLLRQQYFIRNKDMGYDREQVFRFAVNWRQYSALGAERGASMVQAFEQTLRRHAAVGGVCRANESPVDIEGTNSGSVRFDGMPADRRFTVYKLSADVHFAEVFGIRLSEGRWFEPGNAADENHVLLNETAARQLGLPEPWLGQRFSIHGNEGRVIGLIRDFHFSSLHKPIAPLVVYNTPNWRGLFFVKTRPGQSAEALAAAEKVWKSWFPQYPFKFHFLDDDFQRQYRAEQQAATLFQVFSGLAVLIACLGLFGLATFVAAQRTREMGIRKVLGASVASITLLLTRDFLRLVCWSMLIASPLAWYLMQHWLAGFAYRADMPWWLFVLAGALALLAALVTAGSQGLRAALANPVQTLKS
jgi:putative ABC transport system permease protein